MGAVLGRSSDPDAEAGDEGTADRLTTARLDDTDLAQLRRLVTAEPVLNAVLDARLQAVPAITSRRFGGVLSGAFETHRRLRAAAFHGGNLLPVGGDPESWTVLGRQLAAETRVCTAIVGDEAAVSVLWTELRAGWGVPRLVRDHQPLLLLDDAGSLPPTDPRLRRATLADLDAYLPAAAAMFTEELDISPYEAAHGGEYRARVAGSIRDGRAFLILDDAGEVAFKADLGALTRHTCQVQGVWTRPDLRGRGLGTVALAGVLHEALRLAPTVSLYVNDFNTAARRMYDTLGMRQVGTLRTVLF